MSERSKARKLVKRLHTSDRIKIYAAARELIKIYSPDMLEDLIGALRDQDSITRKAIAQVLGELKDPRAAEPLIGALGDTDSDLRKFAAEALGKIKNLHAVEPLIGALGDQDKDVRTAAAQALGNIGDARAVEPLIKMFGGSDTECRKAAAQALGSLKDPRAVEPFMESLRRKEYSVRIAVVEALSHIGDMRATDLLTDLLIEAFNSGVHAKKTDLVRWSAKVLGNIGDARAVVPLIAAFKDNIHKIQFNTIYSGTPAEMQLKIPFNMFVNTLKYECLDIVEALGKIGDPRAVEPLSNALKNTKWNNSQMDDLFIVNAITTALNKIAHHRKTLICFVCGQTLEYLGGPSSIFGPDASVTGADQPELEQWSGLVCPECKQVFCSGCVGYNGLEPNPCPHCGAKKLQPATRAFLSQTGIL